MKKFLITFKVLYDGVLTSKEDIGELTLEIEMDEERIRKKYQFIESENDYDFDEYNHRIPVNYVAMYVKSASVHTLAVTMVTGLGFFSCATVVPFPGLMPASWQTTVPKRLTNAAV